MLDIKKMLMKIAKTPLVVEQGTSGIWKYRKWSDGTAECWGLYETSGSVTTQYGGIYYTTMFTINFPSGLFISAPVLTASAPSNSGVGGLATRDVSKDAIITQFWNGSSFSGTLNFRAGLHAIGRWK